MRAFLGQTVLRSLLIGYRISIGIARLVGRKHVPLGPSEPRTVALTGTFYSENWIMNHLRPIAGGEACGTVWLVCTYPIPETPRVRVIKPNATLGRLLGETPSRLLTFAWLCIRHRPQVIGGFHILLNGLVANVLARLVGASSVYFCGGGPREVLQGGFISDNRLFKLLKRPDAWLEKQLIQAVGHATVVVTMGKRTVDFFKRHGVQSRFAVLPGGIASVPEQAQRETKQYDLIFVGRLVQVKRLDLFLGAVAELRTRFPGITAAIVGRGELDEYCRSLSRELGVEQHVTFAGFQRDVTTWLARSRIFVLTSDSEGLSLALMEALMSGLPCVVSDVGELGEIVESGTNGRLVQERTPLAFAEAIAPLLADGAQLERMSTAARQSARQFELAQATSNWNQLLSEI